VSKQQKSPPLTLFMHGCSHYQGSSFPTLAVQDQVNGMLIATILSGGWTLGGVREHAVRCARPMKSGCTSEGECGADLRVCFGSGRNKFDQLLIPSRKSSGRFVPCQHVKKQNKWMHEHKRF